jgi:hypothetical protein
MLLLLQSSPVTESIVVSAANMCRELISSSSKRGLCSTRASARELLGQEFPDSVFSVIKWPPRQEPAYEAGMASPFNKVKL